MATEKRPDTPLATSPNAVFMSAQDSTKVKTPYIPGRATPEQRAAAKEKREKNSRIIDSTFNAHAAQEGMTREQYSKMLDKRKRQPDAKSYECKGPDFSSTTCGISKAGAKLEKKEWKKK